MGLDRTQDSGKHHGHKKQLKRQFLVNHREKLKPGYIIESQLCKYEVIELLGSGGFGDVYRVKDSSKKIYAVKTEYHKDSVDRKLLRLKIECEILKLATEVSDPKLKSHFVPFYDSGRFNEMRFMVMALVGPSIFDLRKKIPSAEFSKDAAWRIAVETLEGIADLHGIGYIHRDIKPANFAIGVDENRSTIYLLDFGISRKFLTPEGEHKPPREKTKFVGTVGFASRRCHEGVEQSRKDDLETWCYMVIDLCDHQNFPWKHLRDKDQVYPIKCELFKCSPKNKALKKVFKNFHQVMKYIDELAFSQTPDYYVIRQQMDDIAKESKLDQDPNWVNPKWIGEPKMKNNDKKPAASDEDVEESDGESDSDKKKHHKKRTGSDSGKKHKEGGGGARNASGRSGKKSQRSKKGKSPKKKGSTTNTKVGP
ncbi:unnamed protein product, partial [Mesorhabditis spiculigera]